MSTRARQARLKYRITDDGHEGLGMVANGPLNRGDLILAETPLLEMPLGPEVLYDPDRFYNITHSHGGESVVDAAVRHLDPRARNSLRQLRASIPTLPDFLSIVATNGWDREEEINGVRNLVIYVCCDISRINHSCRPNAVAVWNGQLRKHVVHACEPIADGEEITLNYQAGNDEFIFGDRAFRRAWLKKHYNFECRCRECNSTRRAVTINNAARWEVWTLKERLIQIRLPEGKVDTRDHAVHRPDWVEWCLGYIDGLKKLGILNGNLVAAYSELSKLYEAFGQHAHPLATRTACLEPDCGFPEHHGAFYDEAIRWAREAWKWAYRCSGENHPDVQELRRRLNRLEELRAGSPFSPV